MKQNDWIVAIINNPTYDPQDFQYISGLTLDNTQLLPKESYLKSSFIRDNKAFKDNNGNFSEDLFNTIYNEAAQKFQDFSTESEIDEYQYSMWDALRPKNGKVRDLNFTLSREKNPQHISVGIAGINEISYPNKSMRELAQSSKIYDPATNTYLDKSVDELSLWRDPAGYFKSIFGDPLVYATYDEDTEEIDPVTGNKVLHKKGEWKVNEEGEYYIEKLNGRSLIGKQVVSSLDYLTPENSEINKYDFFDSDDLEKSVGGTIAKNIASVIPLAIPYIGQGYAGLLVGRELSKSLPMLYGIINGLSGEDNVNHKFLNTLAAYGQTFTGSTSDYAQQNTFSVENFANLMSDVALQWGQQKFIAQTFSKLTSGGDRALKSAYAKAQKEYVDRSQKAIEDAFAGKLPADKMAAYIGTGELSKIQSLIESGKWAETAFGKAALNKYLPAAQKIAESRMRTGQDLSLIYMAMVSNTDVYESVLEKGGTPFEAASIALGSMIGMFSVDKYLGLGEMFFNDEPARRALRDAAKKNAEDLISSAGFKQAQEETRKGIIGAIQRGIDVGKKAVSDYHGTIKDRTLGFAGKSLGEGLEEVSEELIADLSKTLGELAGKLGYFSQSDYGAWENALDRYMMSFLGGAAGGGLSYGVDAIQNRNKSTQEFQTDLVYLLRQGRKDEILAEFDHLKKQGKLGSKTLSYKTTNSDSGDVFLTAETEQDSQSQYIYDTLVKTVNQLDLILNDNQVKLSEDEVFDKMVQGEYRQTALSDFLKGDKEGLKNISYITKYQQDFQKLAEDIVNKESEIQEYISKTPDPQKRNTEFQEKLEKLKEEKQQLLDYRDYLFGEGSLGYVEKMLFAMDTKLSGQFLALNYNQYIRQASYGKSIEELTAAELESYNKGWEQYKKTRRENLDEAFKLYKDMEHKINPSVQELSDNIESWLKQSQSFIESFKGSPKISYDTRLDGETDEEYNNRNTKLEGETDEDFKNRKEARVNLLEQLYIQRLSEWINTMSQMPLDRNQFRAIESQIQILKKNKAQRIIRTFQLENNPELTHKIWSLLEQSDLKDLEKLKGDIKTLISDSYEQQINLDYAGRSMYDEFTWDGFRIKLQDLGESTEGYLTYGDMYKILEGYKQELEATKTDDKQPYDPEGYLKRLSNDTLNFDLNSSDKQEQANAAFLQWYSEAIINDEVREAEWDTPIEITPDYLRNKVSERLDDTLLGERIDQRGEERNAENGLNKRIDNIVNNLLSDSLISALSKLENKAFSVNPVSGVIEAISKISSNSNTNIHEFLEQIYSQYQNGENSQSFQLSDPQEKILLQFIEDLQMSQAFIHSASVSSNYDTPVGHNKAINEFVQNHKNVFTTDQVLPEISNDYANFLLNEVYSFIIEANNWIELSRNNTSNKARKFTEAQSKYVDTVSQFFRDNRDGFKVNPEVDLLSGYEAIENPNTILGVAKTEQLLHNNYLKAKAKGVTIEQILDAILPKITNTNELISQLTSKLDENLDYSKLTSYDKLNLVVRSLALSPKTFYANLLKFVQDNGNIAPLSIQEEIAKTVLAQQNDSNLINSVLNYLSNKLKIALPILENTSIVLGLGGAGKTAVIARMASSEGENVWLSGPTQTQVNNLQGYLPKGQGISKDQLLINALGAEQYAQFKVSFTRKDDGTWKTDGKFGSIVPGLDGTKTVKLKDNIVINKISNAPKLIIIDEATHFNTAELQVISKFAKLNNIQILLLGDDHQNGSIQNGLMMNLDREVCLSWRTPKLFISLRDNNVQKSNNLLSIVGLIDQLDNSFNVGNDREVSEKILNHVIPNFALNYYNKETFNGELITKELPTDLINKLSGSIGFIGPSTSDNYKKLQESGKDVTLVDPVSVQGQEYDYVIVDKDWTLKENSPASLYFFLRDLYTMISRSRNGTILIENGDLNRFHSLENELTSTTSIKPAIKTFRDKRIPYIQNIVDNLVEEEIIPQNVEQAEKIETDGLVEGTNATQEELESEIEPIKDNSSFNQEEFEQTAKEDEAVVENTNTPIRCYSNVSYSGIPLKNVWTNNGEVRKNLGIFINKGDIIRSGEDKRQLVKKLLQLKCVFNYGTSNWNLLPKDIKEKFSQEAFENAEYFISVEDPSESNTLVGLTDLDPDKRTINGKVVTLVASILGRDRQTYEVTLGGLADPQTWKKNEEDIIRRIQKRIDNNDHKSDELREYLKNLHRNIISYENRIAEITKSNQRFRINTPEFSGLTTLVKSDTELRLESIDPESTARPFDAACQYALKSDVYVLTGDIPGVSPELKGKPVMYVSSNVLLDPSQLKTLYEQQKNDSSLVPQVRMIVLDNMGVSFDSLYRKKYQDIYTTAKGETKYYFPVEAEPTGLRMYKSIWNFRANLQQFLKAYNTFKQDSGLSQEDIIKLCELDNRTYKVILGDQSYISEQEYRSKVDDKTKELLKPIWDFNDNLKDYRQFRLGYSKNNGAYLRKLTNLSEDGPYQDRDINNIIGIYINPDLAEQYSQILDKLFSNILDKIVPPGDRNPQTYITKEKEKGWFRQVTNDRKITINMVDYSENLDGTVKTGTLNFENDQALSAILPILVETAKFLEFKTLNQTELEEYLQQNPNRYAINFGDERLDWWSIDQVLEGDRPAVDTDKDYDYTLFAPGINPYETDPDTGKPIGIIDERLSNLFSLMFHGLTSTKKYNDFTKGEIRATDADFKYGIFTDPVLAPKQGIDNTSALTITNHRLFGAKVYPGLPMIGLSLDPYSQDQPIVGQQRGASIEQSAESQPVVVVQQQGNILNKFMSNSDIELLKQNGISFTEEQLEDIETVKDLQELVDKKIITKFKKFWSTQNSNLEEIISLPLSTFIDSTGGLGIISLNGELRSQDDEMSSVQTAQWNQNHLVVKMDSGKAFTIDQSPNGVIINPVETNNGVSIADTTIDDLGTQIKQIIEEYTQPNNEDGLDQETASQLTGFVDRIIKKGKLSEDVSVETKNRIINQIQEALQNTDLESDINNALTKLKNVCKLN